MGPCLNPGTRPLFPLGAVPCQAGHPTPAYPFPELPEFPLSSLNSGGRGLCPSSSDLSGAHLKS